MKAKILGLLAAGLLAQASAVQAALVTFDFTVTGEPGAPLGANGTIEDGVFGTVCTAGGCSLDHEEQGWLASLGNPGREFAYAIGAERLFFGTITFTRRDVAEPATLALVGFGLLGFASARRRKATRSHPEALTGGAAENSGTASFRGRVGLLRNRLPGLPFSGLRSRSESAR